GWRSIGWGLPALLAVRLFRPLLETVAYLLVVAGLIVGWVTPALAGFVLVSTIGMGMVVSMAAVALHELAGYEPSDPGRLSSLFFAAIPESLGYRQIRNLWLVGAFFTAGK